MRPIYHKLNIFLFILLCASIIAADDNYYPKIKIETNKGNMMLELYPDKAPKTVANFLRYVDNGFYDNTLIHRIIPGFVIQGGGFTPDYKRKETDQPVQNEADNGLKNIRGSISMARTHNPHSASSQFFINLKDNKALDHRDKSLRGWGYCVFGQVITGMQVADTIAKVPTQQKPMPDSPIDAVIITHISRQTPNSKPKIK